MIFTVLLVVIAALTALVAPRISDWLVIDAGAAESVRSSVANPATLPEMPAFTS